MTEDLGTDVERNKLKTWGIGVERNKLKTWGIGVERSKLNTCRTDVERNKLKTWGIGVERNKLKTCRTDVERNKLQIEKKLHSVQNFIIALKFSIYLAFHSIYMFCSSTYVYDCTIQLRVQFSHCK